MMSVLINMEMPQSCYDCPFEESVNFCYWEKGTCPLIEIPPHGRLIDADALCEGRVSNDNVLICAKCAPTVIEAEEGET